MYNILPFTRQRAKKIGVTVAPSTNPEKKIDVFKEGRKVASVGAVGYSDFPTYTKTKGKKYANERRKLYHKRHEKNEKKKGTPAYYAGFLLW